MVIVWITNIPIGDMARKIGCSGGLWMDALLDQLREKQHIQLIVATQWNVKQIEQCEINGIKYILLPKGMQQTQKDAYREFWKSIFDENSPDLLQVWGTEGTHPIIPLRVAKEKEVKSVVYIQGILKAIALHADGHLPLFTKLRYTTLRDIYRRQIWVNLNSWFRRRAKSEEEILELSSGVIVENKWAEEYCKSINSDLNIYRIPLSIGRDFSLNRWTSEKMEPHTIMCNASVYAYKGVHNIVKALALVKEKYPDVKLFVPGRQIYVGKGVLRQKNPGYWLYIADLIKKYNLEKNVEFVGYLNQSELAERLSRANVFVLSSAIENHSSSLKEAMFVGTPAIASMVGGVPEYFEFGKCGYMYRYEEYDCLARYIIDLFERRDLCEEFSNEARKLMREQYATSSGELMELMYSEVIKHI